jgi:2-polyprenyl-6-methoxyphenol hydroxylase-like FAD-dependent oxidoreductase
LEEAVDNLDKVLVVGGGIGGMAAALELRRAGVSVDLIDIDPGWRVYGAGITITGPTLRAYRRLGLLEQIKTEGAITSGIRLRHFSGAHIADLDEPPIENGLPATGGILRPVLHAIMSKEVRALGTNVRLGLTVDSIRQDATGVDVVFSDQSWHRYDLVIGADGIYSKLRAIAFEERVKPTYTGQGSWRVLADRPENFDKNEFYLGHLNSVGITACSPTQVYAFALHPYPKCPKIEADAMLPALRELLADFGGNIAGIRENLGPDSSIVFRPFEFVLQPKPWNRGRVVLIGDAAHATTAHLGSGAGMAVEDAIVLVEELGHHSGDVEGALASYTKRRFDRCRDVVEASVAIGNAQLAGASPEQVARMTAEGVHRLAAAY